MQIYKDDHCNLIVCDTSNKRLKIEQLKTSEFSISLLKLGLHENFVQCNLAAISMSKTSFREEMLDEIIENVRAIVQIKRGNNSRATIRETGNLRPVGEKHSFNLRDRINDRIKNNAQEFETCVTMSVRFKQIPGRHNFESITNEMARSLSYEEKSLTKFIQKSGVLE